MYRNFNAAAGLLLDPVNISAGLQHRMSAELSAWQPVYRIMYYLYI
jgi:hypothetical protein